MPGLLFKLLSLLMLAFYYTPAHMGNNNETPAKKKYIKWAVQKSSSIRIQGSTNVNTFGCDITGYYQPDTLYCADEAASNSQVVLNGKLALNIRQFDCHNRMLTSDLRKTLKADEYPTLTIRFLSLERVPTICSSKDIMKGWVEIELAGKQKKFEVCYTFVQQGAAAVQLHGARSFSFADFNLVPPKKIGGLIKVKDKFEVDFTLLLNPVL